MHIYNAPNHICTCIYTGVLIAFSVITVKQHFIHQTKTILSNIQVFHAQGPLVIAFIFLVVLPQVTFLLYQLIHSLDHHLQAHLCLLLDLVVAVHYQMPDDGMLYLMHRFGERRNLVDYKSHLKMKDNIDWLGKCICLIIKVCFLLLCESVDTHHDDDAYPHLYIQVT